MAVLRHQFGQPRQLRAAIVTRGAERFDVGGETQEAIRFAQRQMRLAAGERVPYRTVQWVHHIPLWPIWRWKGDKTRVIYA